MGDGTTVNRLAPTKIESDDKWISVSAGYDHSLALKSSGTLWTYGDNFFGQLGEGSTSSMISPTRVDNPPDPRTGGPYTGTEGVEITLDGSGSEDVEGVIVNYEWDIDNDGTYEYSSLSPTQSHTYTQDGVYTIILRVTDSIGVKAVASTSATIANNPPTADFTGAPASGDVPLTVDFTNNSSGGDPALSYEWDFDNNGSVDSTLTDPSAVYTGPGMYAVKLTTTDSDNDTNTLTRVNYITACFSPVNIVGDSTAYSSLQTAYEAAIDDDTIEVRSTSFSGGLSINRNITVTVDGSYDCLHSSQSGETTINGDMSVSDGAVVIQSGTLKVQ